MKWVIPVSVIDRSIRDSFFVGEVGVRRKVIFRNAYKDNLPFAYIAERNSVPAYFERVIEPYESL